MRGLALIVAGIGMLLPSGYLHSGIDGLLQTVQVGLVPLSFFAVGLGAFLFLQERS